MTAEPVDGACAATVRADSRRERDEQIERKLDEIQRQLSEIGGWDATVILCDIDRLRTELRYGSARVDRQHMRGVSRT